MGSHNEQSEPGPAAPPVVNKEYRGPMAAYKALTVMCALNKVAQAPNMCLTFTSFVARLEVEEPFLGHNKAFELARSLIEAGKLKLLADADGIETVYMPGVLPCP
jgi:hypothetical protein